MSDLNFLPGTIVTGLLSHPVGHSFSPSIHNSAARVLGLNMVYLAFNVRPDSLEDALTGMRALGIKGFNLSLPHKKKVLPFLDHHSLEVKYTGAANTIANHEGKLTGYNTDIKGFTKAIEIYGEFFRERPALVLGAGGAASAAIYSLIVEYRIRKIFIINRTLQNSALLVMNFLEHFKDVEFVILPIDEPYTATALNESGLIVNTTSIGMHPNVHEIVDLPYEALNRDSLVFDMIYNPVKTKLLEEGERAGCITSNGLYMLLYQAAESFKIWTGMEMPVEEVKKLLPQF